jgi:membrane protease YdiL (CAAX protease family)
MPFSPMLAVNEIKAVAAVAMTLFDRAASSLLLCFTQAHPMLRVICFFIAWVGCWLPIAIAIALAINWHPPKPLAAEQKLPLLASLYLIAPILLWGIAGVEGGSFSTYGLPPNPVVLVSLGLGFGLAVISLVVIFGIEWALGWISWQQSNWRQLKSVWLPTLLLGLWIGGTEELIFRGFLLNSLMGGGFKEASAVSAEMLVKPTATLWVAAAISSLIFAVLHLVWEIRETLPQIPGLWLMGMVLVLARLCEVGDLGLAWGLHAGWIWGLASIEAAGLIKYTGNASVWITGLAGKPLAGAVGILCLLGTAAVVWIMELNLLASVSEKFY